MLIDWFTVGAQALNFLILVWLLRRFLYRPILDAIDARERGIAAALADADARQAGAQAARAEYEQKNAQLDQQRAELLRQADADARTQGAALLEAARAAAETVRVKQQEALAAEQHALQAELKRRAQQQVFAITHKALVELADATLEQRMADLFITRLRALDAVARARICAAAAGGSALLRSAFELTAAQRATLQQALEGCCGQLAALSFETAPQLVSGIEFSANGYQLSWNIDAYLTELEHSVCDAMQEAPKAANSPPSQAVSAPAIAAATMSPANDAATPMPASAPSTEPPRAPAATR